jgi:large subunit ribosomal protein L17
MRHRKAAKKLGRESSHRRAMLRNMVTSLFKYEQLETTDAKAKQLRPVAEKIITLAKRGDLHARRQALAYITDKAITHRLFAELRERYLDRQGGYLRIIKKGNRRGDGAAISVVQLLPAEEGKKKAKKKGKAPKTAGAAEEKKKKKASKAEEEEKRGPKKGEKKDKKSGEKVEKKAKKKESS